MHNSKLITKSIQVHVIIYDNVQQIISYFSFRRNFWTIRPHEGYIHPK